MQADKVIIGLLAHVDAGKTTLSEALLYQTKAIRKIGRVDHHDSFLDYNLYERQRGITVFAKEARFQSEGQEYIIEDTPGHADLASETERVLPILDYAVLIIDASAKIKSYTRQLMALIKRHHVPAIIFMNKMDQCHADRQDLIKNLQEELDPNIVDFTDEEELYEDIAVYDEELLNNYLAGRRADDSDIYRLFHQERFYPCLFGSALKQENTGRLIELIVRLCQSKQYPDDFRAYVYRINKDRAGNILTHIKIMGGSLKNKTKLKEEKIDEIRLYSGNNYQSVQEARAGDLVALKGVKNLIIGEAVNDNQNNPSKVMTPYFNYEITADDTDPVVLYRVLKEMEKENPLYGVRIINNAITISLMGEMQKELLTAELKDRYDLIVKFGQLKIAYRETVSKKSYGIGHFEPLHHYAEVHLTVEPLSKGEGKIVKASESVRDNYLKGLMDYLNDSDVCGVLSGGVVSDILITVVAVRTSLNHTLAEDVRMAADFAIRNALLDNEMVLLVPKEEYRIITSSNEIARIIYELDRLDAEYVIGEYGEKTMIRGQITAAHLNELLSQDIFRKGEARAEHSFGGYAPFTGTSLPEEIDYDPLNDKDHPSGSIFFRNGAGFYVSKDETYAYAHIKPLTTDKTKTTGEYRPSKVSDEEIKRVFANANPHKKEKYIPKTKKDNSRYKTKAVHKESLYIADGYNLMHQSGSGRDELIADLSYYAAMKGSAMWVVFDAYKVDNPTRLTEGPLKIIYTRKTETADEYIQRKVKELSDKYNITVISSDSLIQISVFSDGANRMSSRALFGELERLKSRKNPNYDNGQKNQPLKELLAGYKEDEK